MGNVLNRRQLLIGIGGSVATFCLPSIALAFGGDYDDGGGPEQERMSLHRTRSDKLLFLPRDKIVKSPVAWLSFAKRYPEQVSNAEPIIVRLDNSSMKEVKKVNLHVNSQEYTPDPEKKDVWNPNPIGDCEDKALAKRWILYQKGVPLSSMNLTLCFVPNYGYHAVLCLHTTEGDMILDNLHSLVIPWYRLKFYWTKMGYAGNTWRKISNYST